MEHNQGKDDHMGSTAPPSTSSLDRGEETSSSAQNGKGASLPDRLWASGQMAARAMTTPSAQAVQSLSSSSSTKAGPLPSFSASAGEPSNITQDVASHGKSASFAATSASGSRPSDLRSSTAEAFNEFTAQSQEPLLLKDDQGTHSWLGPAATKQAEEMDGLAVVKILSQPDADEMMPTEDDFDTGLSPEAASKLRSALFDTGLHGKELPWNDMLNFTPQFLASPSGRTTEDSEQLTGTSDPAAATDIWIHQWGDVLSCYTDEVWGDLAALVSEARHEIKKMTSPDEAGPPAPGQTKALGRLRMILAHLRGASD